MNSKKLSVIVATLLYVLSMLPITAQAYAFDTAGSVLYIQNLNPATESQLIVSALDATDVLFIVYNSGCNPQRTEKFKLTKGEIAEGATQQLDTSLGFLGFNPGESYAILVAGVLIGNQFFYDPTFDIAVFANAESSLGGVRYAALNVEDGFQPQVLNNQVFINLIVPDDVTFQDKVDDDIGADGGDFFPGESRDYFLPGAYAVGTDFCNNDELCSNQPQVPHPCQDYTVRQITTDTTFPIPGPFPPFIEGGPFEPPFRGQLIGLVREQIGGDDPAVVGYQTINEDSEGAQILGASYADHFGEQQIQVPLTLLVPPITSQGLLIPDRSFLGSPSSFETGVTRSITQGATTNFLSIVNHGETDETIVIEAYDQFCVKYDRTFQLTPLETLMIDLNVELDTLNPLLVFVKAVDIDGNLDPTAQISSKVFYEEFNVDGDQEFKPTAEYRFHNVEASQTADKIEFVGPSSSYNVFHSDAATRQTLVVGNPSAVLGGAKTLNIILNQENEDTFSSTQSFSCVAEINPTTLLGAPATGLFGVNVFGDNKELVIGAAFELRTGDATISAEQSVGAERTVSAIPIQVVPGESTNFQVFITPFISNPLDPSWDLTVYGVKNVDESEVKDTDNVVCDTRTFTPGTGEAEAFAANLACKVSPTSTKTILEICNDDMDPVCFELGIHPT